MRQYFSLLLVLAVLITAGCVEEPTPPTPTVTMTQTLVKSTVMTNTPTQTPGPEEMAYLEGLDCAVVEEKVTTYRCMGKVRIKSGIYEEVHVIVKYPDNNTFESGIVAMGGSNPVLKSFIIFPDLKYRDQVPTYSVKLDKSVYTVIMDCDSGIAYVNPPPAKTIAKPCPVVKIITTDPYTTEKPAVIATRIQRSVNPTTIMTICGPEREIYVPP